MTTLFQNMPNAVFCLVIFFAKIIEIVLSSLKTVMLVKGKKLVSSAMAFCEVLIWAFAISRIISDLSTNIWWLLAYCFGYTAGYFLGSIAESKLAIGTMDVCIITPAKHKKDISDYLISEKLGFYISNCEGATGDHVKVDIVLPRKQAPVIRRRIAEICNNNIFVTNYDIPYMHGGYANKGSKARGC